MEASNEVIQGRKKCLTAEYRGLERHQRALKLIDQNICSQRAAALVLDMSRSQIVRAKKATECGRTVGRVGNPPIFNEEEEQECYNYLRLVLPENTYYNDEDFKKEVRS